MSLSRSEYSVLTKTTVGRELRNIMNQATNDPRDRPSVTQIQEQLKKAGIPESHHNDVLARARKLAKQRQDGRNVFELRQIADHETVSVLKELRSSDDLLGEDGLEPDPDRATVESAGAMADRLRHKGRIEWDEATGHGRY